MVYNIWEATQYDHAYSCICQFSLKKHTKYPGDFTWKDGIFLSMIGV